MAPRQPEGPPPSFQPQRPPAPPRYLSTASRISKRSFLSHSSSFEADDERSTSPSRSARSFDSSFGMDDDSINGRALGLRDAGYPGEDTRPTSSKELAGWYMYAFAAETYVVCGVLLSAAPSN